MHKHFSQQLQERIQTLKPLLRKVDELETAVEDCTAQLLEINGQLKRSMNVKSMDTLEKCKKLEVRMTCKSIANNQATSIVKDYKCLNLCLRFTNFRIQPHLKKCIINQLFKINLVHKKKLVALKNDNSFQHFLDSFLLFSIPIDFQ